MSIKFASALGKQAGIAALGKLVSRGAKLVAPRVGPSLASSTVGAGLGAAASDDKLTGGLAGAMTGLAAANPALRSFVQKQVRYAGGATPGKSMGLGNYGKLFFEPKYPGLEPALEKFAPKAAPYIAGGLRKVPYGAMAAGAGVAGHSAGSYLPDQVSNLAYDIELGDSSARKRMWKDTYDRQHEILYRSYAPKSLGGDSTSVGDLHRQVISKVVLPQLKRGPTDGRRMYPNIMNGADIARSLTPFGALQTYALRSYNPGRDTAPTDLADTLQDNRSKLVNDPKFVDSPIAKIYADILLKSDGTGSEAFRRKLKGVTGPYKDMLPPANSIGQVGENLRNVITGQAPAASTIALREAINSEQGKKRRGEVIDSITGELRRP